MLQQGKLKSAPHTNQPPLPLQGFSHRIPHRRGLDDHPLDMFRHELAIARLARVTRNWKSRLVFLFPLCSSVVRRPGVFCPGVKK